MRRFSSLAYCFLIVCVSIPTSSAVRPIGPDAAARAEKQVTSSDDSTMSSMAGLQTTPKHKMWDAWHMVVNHAKHVIAHPLAQLLALRPLGRHVLLEASTRAATLAASAANSSNSSNSSDPAQAKETLPEREAKNERIRPEDQAQDKRILPEDQVGFKIDENVSVKDINGNWARGAIKAKNGDTYTVLFDDKRERPGIPFQSIRAYQEKIDAGVEIVAMTDVRIFENANSDTQIGELQKGEVATASGDVVRYDQSDMLPIQPAGAVERDFVRALKEPAKINPAAEIDDKDFDFSWNSLNDTEVSLSWYDVEMPPKTIPMRPDRPLIPIWLWRPVQAVTGYTVDYGYFYDPGTGKVRYTTYNDFERPMIAMSLVAMLRPPDVQAVVVWLTIWLIPVLLWAAVYKSCVSNKRPPMEAIDDLSYSLDDGDFKQSLCGCCDNVYYCLYGFCCPAVRVGDTASAAGLVGFFPAVLAFLAADVIGLCVGTTLPASMHDFPCVSLIRGIMTICLFVPWRRGIRHRIGGGPVGPGAQAIDYIGWCCCPFFVLTQEAFEVDGANGVQVGCPCNIQVYNIKKKKSKKMPLVGPPGPMPVAVAAGKPAAQLEQPLMSDAAPTMMPAAGDQPMPTAMPIATATLAPMPAAPGMGMDATAMPAAPSMDMNASPEAYSMSSNVPMAQPPLQQ